MKYFVTTCFFSLLFPTAFAQQKSCNTVVTEKFTPGDHSAIIKGKILNCADGKSAGLPLVFVGRKRHTCDSLGNYEIKLKPGTHSVRARSFMFNDVSTKIKLNDGEGLVLNFFLQLSDVKLY